MSDQTQNTEYAEKAEDYSQLLTLYTLLFEKHNQEGDGIWGRFNIMIGINVMLLGVFAFLFSTNPRPALWREISMGLSIAGFLASCWSLFVLHELWLWHEYWRDMCRRVEKSFPKRDAWVRSHSELEDRLKRDVGMCRRWLLAYTQPFIVLFILIWVATLVLLLAGQI